MAEAPRTDVMSVKEPAGGKDDRLFDKSGGIVDWECIGCLNEPRSRDRRTTPQSQVLFTNNGLAPPTSIKPSFAPVDQIYSHRVLPRVR